MGYCFMTTQKIKSLGSLSSKYIHNYRKVDVPNADPELIDKNDNYYYTTDDDGIKLDYTDAWKQRMENVPGFRSDAVRAIEVVMTFSREENIDIETWKQKNLEWLQKTFDVAPDGKSNIIDVIYHADEPGNVHCHAIVIPVDEKGNLNASRFLDGRAALTKLQTEYAKDMKEFGLERGLQNGQARHQDIKKYYADLNNSINNLSEPKENETANDYRDRVLEELETIQAAAKRERDRKDQEMQRKLAEKRIKQEKYFKQQWEKLQTQKNELIRQANEENRNLLNTIERQKNQIERNEKYLTLQEEKKAEIKDQIDAITLKIGDMETIEKKVQFFDTFQKQYQLLSQQEPERARIFSEELKHMSELTSQKTIDR